MTAVLDFTVTPPRQVVLAGDPDDSRTAGMKGVLSPVSSYHIDDPSGPRRKGGGTTQAQPVPPEPGPGQR